MSESENPTPPPESNNKPSSLTRRKTLGILAGVAAAIGIGAEAVHKSQQQDDQESSPESGTASPGQSVTSPELSPVRAEQLRYHLGSEREYNIKDLRHYPDGRIAQTKLHSGETVYFISAGQDTQRLRYDNRSQSFVRLDSGPVFGHDTSKQFRNGYAGMTSVLPRDDNPEHLLFVYHAEQHAPQPYGQSDTKTFTARIGYGFSDNEGKTCTDLGVLLEGQNFQEPGTRISGAGQPSALILEEGGQRKLRIYCIDWTGLAADQIYLYEADLDASGKPGKLRGHTKEGFKEDFQKGELEPVIKPPVNAEGYYAALPDVQKVGNGFRAVFESKDGFYLIQSEDGITWDRTQKIMDRGKDTTWYSYPSIINVDGAEHLAYAKRRQGEDYHHLALRKIN